MKIDQYNHMSTQLNQQIDSLNAANLAELALFVEFLLLKQDQKSHSMTRKKSQFLEGIQPIEIPVSNYMVQRDDIYENRI